MINKLIHQRKAYQHEKENIIGNHNIQTMMQAHKSPKNCRNTLK
jgi:hypothetical protein